MHVVVGERVGVCVGVCVYVSAFALHMYVGAGALPCVGVGVRVRGGLCVWVSVGVNVCECVRLDAVARVRAWSEDCSLYKVGHARNTIG